MGITIPIDRLNEFTDIFPELDWENGEFIHNLKGKYIRLAYDENFEIYSISHIVKDLTYMVKKELTMTPFYDIINYRKEQI